MDDLSSPSTFGPYPIDQTVWPGVSKESDEGLLTALRTELAGAILCWLISSWGFKLPIDPLCNLKYKAPGLFNFPNENPYHFQKSLVYRG